MSRQRLTTRQLAELLADLLTQIASQIEATAEALRAAAAPDDDDTLHDDPGPELGAPPPWSP